MNANQPDSLTVAVAQPFCFPGDIDGNMDRMEPLVAQAAQTGARLILFSECGVTGYTADSPMLSRGDTAFQRLSKMAREHGMVIIPGFLERDGADVYVSQGVFYPDGTVQVQRKGNPARVESTIPGFRAGPKERAIFEVDGVRCAIAICADAGIPNLYRDLSNQGVGLILIPTAGCGPYHLGYRESSLDDPEVFERYLKSAEKVVFSPNAIRNCRTYRMAMVSCNQMADNGQDYFHPGHSMIVDASGELVGVIPGSFVFEHLRPQVISGALRAAVIRRAPAARS